MGSDNKGETVECRNSNDVMFYIPLAFAIQTRFLRRSKLGAIVWATEYLIPVLLSMLLISWPTYNFVSAIIAILAVYNLYEIGYIQNDCETIKKENKPTKRLSDKQLNYYESHKTFIYGLRMLWGIIFSIYFILTGIPWIWIIVTWMVIPYYLLYNYLRGRICLYLIMPLTSYRYCYPLILYGIIGNISMACLMILVLFVAYPLPTFIEQCAGGKGSHPENWSKFFLSNFDDRFIFRVRYYFVMSIITITLSFCSAIPLSVSIIPVYYLMDRLPQVKMKKINTK